MFISFYYPLDSSSVTPKSIYLGHKSRIKFKCWRSCVMTNIGDPEKVQDWRFHNTFATHNSSLPTMYMMLKTHKLNSNASFNEVVWDSFKMRPIVSYRGSPSEKVGWLINYMLTPLMGAIPSHLRNIHSQIECLRNIPSDELRG